jgi:predicted DNA-binding helix-hairpin-helix protein
MPSLPTVFIAYGDGFLRINESDFDPKKHTPFTGEIPKSVPVSTLINLNEADVNVLRSLPNVGVAIAKKIVDNRPLTPEKLTELGIEIDLSLVTF